MSSRAPTDKRGRVRVAKILDAAAELVAQTNDPATVTTTAVAEKSDLSVTTVYRYFADRDEIVEALFDRETIGLDELLIKRFVELEAVTVSGLMETMMRCNYEYFLENPRASAIWFGARGNRDVSRQVSERYAYIGGWFMTGARAAKMIEPETPEFGGELIIWLGDAALRFVFSEQRSEAERDAVVEEWMRMIDTRIDEYSTPIGREGVPPMTFLEKAGMFVPPRIAD